MASHVICGTCGALLEHPGATCRTCGSHPAGRPRRWARSKHPLLAALLGIVPGLGHLYVGEYKKGIGIMAALGALELAGLDLDLSVIGAALGIPTELGGLGLWIYSIVDAYHAARRARMDVG
jgi:ribosomal protein L40E